MGDLSPKVIVKSVNRINLSQLVLERIVQFLASGQLKPGDKLPSEIELMEILNASRPVLSET